MRSLHPAARWLTLLSLAAWFWFVPARTHSAFHDLDNGTFTDHFSHMNAARLFPRVGLDLWRKPVEQMFRRATFPELMQLPPAMRYPGTFVVPGWPLDKPLQQSWSHIPRLYPPGDLLLVAPIAAAYHLTSLSADSANLMLILLFILCAHLSLLFCLDAALRADELAAPLGLLGALVLYGESIRWAAAGFYDSAAILPLVLCARYLRQERGLAALCAYCAAAFLHFRAFYLAPWALQAAWIFWRGRQWQDMQRRDYIALVITALLALCSLGTFAMVFPAMGTLEDVNPMHKGDAVWLACLVFAAICALAFTLARSWEDLAVLAWIGLLFPLQKNTYNWYPVLLLPWLAAPVAARVVKRAWVGEGRLVAFLVSAGFIYDRWAFPPPWLWQIIFGGGTSGRVP